MRIPCPCCGPRSAEEFAYLGDAAPTRPTDGTIEDLADYVYIRENPAGQLREYWYHASGCRAWIVVTRNTLTHAVTGATLARP